MLASQRHPKYICPDHPTYTAAQHGIYSKTNVTIESYYQLASHLLWSVLRGDIMRVKVFAVGAALLATALLAACGGSGDSGPSEDTGDDGGTQDTASDEPLSDDESDFLRQVGIAFSQSQANFSAFERILSQEQESAEALLSALSEAGAGTSFDPVIEALEELEPPERFRADHEVALEALRAVAAADREIGQAAEDGDIVAFTVGNMQLGLLQGELALGVSPEYCEALSSDPVDRPLCERDAAGGEYGLALHSIMSRFEAEFSPRVGALTGPDTGLFAAVTFAPVLTAEDYSRLDAAVGADIEDVLERTRRDIQALDAPAEFQADHDRLLRYIDDMRSAVQAALEAGEQQDSIGRMEEVDRARMVFCGVADDFSPEFESIVEVHFDVPDPRFCAGL